MGDYSQANRPMRVDTVLGEDKLLLESFSGQEGVSTPFSFTLDLLSEDDAIDADKLLRTKIQLTLFYPDGSERIIHGMVSRFVQLGQREMLTVYRAEMVPWLWFLSLTSDCKIYQEKSVLEIVEDVFKEQGYSDYDIKTVGSYGAREYCVQYRETHLNFVTRLLEEEGIFYFFKHEKGKHTLVLADSTSSVKGCPLQDEVRMATTPGPWQDEDVVTTVQHERAVRSGTVTYRDYDFEKPSTQLESTLSGDGEGEVYDYPGGFTEVEDGDRYARLRLEELEQYGDVLRGHSTCRAFQSGFKFTLKEHYKSGLNATYHLLRVHHSGSAGDYRSWDSAPFDYTNDFVCIPEKVPFRPPRTALKPVVQGSQTAKVVGKSGEDIWVDKHGRVKVQFHWDRLGKNDENSSCWVRVSSAWAGKGWGFIQIPRIGQEVIVDFLEGDPDQPIVTGRVYNAELMPPYALPDNQTQSGLKTRSSKKGGTDDYNEIMLEDNKGKELIRIHAQKDLETTVENNETRKVQNDRTTTITNNEKKTIEKGDETIEISKGSQTLTIKMGDQATTLDMGNVGTQAKLGNIESKADVGKISMEALQSVELKVGGSSIKVDQMGVTIKGMMVKIEGTVMAEVKGLMTNVKADAMLQAQGGITMIN